MAVLASHEPCVMEVQHHAAASADRIGQQLRRLVAPPCDVSCKVLVSTNKRISLDSSLAAQELQKPSPALVEGRSRSIPVGTAAGPETALPSSCARCGAL